MIYAAIFVSFILGSLFRHYVVTWYCDTKLKPEDSYKHLPQLAQEQIGQGKNPNPIPGKYDHIPLPDDTWIRWNGEARIPVAEDDDFSVMWPSEDIFHADDDIRANVDYWRSPYHIIAYKIHGKLKPKKGTSENPVMLGVDTPHLSELAPDEYLQIDTQSGECSVVKKPKAMTAPINNSFADAQQANIENGLEFGLKSKTHTLPKIPRGWKRHDGKNCPVKKSQIVEVICKNGDIKPKKTVKKRK